MLKRKKPIEKKFRSEEYKRKQDERKNEVVKTQAHLLRKPATPKQQINQTVNDRLLNTNEKHYTPSARVEEAIIPVVDVPELNFDPIVPEEISLNLSSDISSSLSKRIREIPTDVYMKAFQEGDMKTDLDLRIKNTENEFDNKIIYDLDYQNFLNNINSTSYIRGPFELFFFDKFGIEVTKRPNTENTDIYKGGIEFIDNNGNVVARIAGTKNGEVQSSYVAEPYRNNGVGKQLYFDWNRDIYDTYGTTLRSSPYLQIGAVELYPGGPVRSISSLLWNGMKDKGAATLEGPSFNRMFVMATPDKISEIYDTTKLLSDANDADIPNWILKPMFNIKKVHPTESGTTDIDRAIYAADNQVPIWKLVSTNPEDRFVEAFRKNRDFYLNLLIVDRITNYYKEKGYSGQDLENAVQSHIKNRLVNMMSTTVATYPDDLLLSKRHYTTGNAKGVYRPSEHSAGVVESAINKETPEHELYHAATKGKPVEENEKIPLRVTKESIPKSIVSLIRRIFGNGYYGQLAEKDVRMNNTLKQMIDEGYDINNLTQEDVDRFFDRPTEELNSDTQSLLEHYNYKDLLKALKKWVPVYIIGAGLGLGTMLYMNDNQKMKKGGLIRKIQNISYAKSGSKISIKKKNRGKFTEYCNGKVTQDCIDKAKKSGNKKLVKRAVFAENARKWKH